jgi:hypothetical protein
MTNIRIELENALRAPIADAAWDQLVELGYAGEVEVGAWTIDDLAAKVRDLQAAFSGRVPSSTNELPSTDAATSARIDALSAIYAAWAEGLGEVRRFRERELVDYSAPEFRAWAKRQGPYPDLEPQLLQDAEVLPWITKHHNARAPNGDGDEHVRTLIGDGKPVRHLWFVAEQQERAVTVDSRGPLGDLAKLASDLADRYRWQPSEAATFVLTGRTPEVLLYVGSAQIRPGQTNVMSRVTMTLDPALTPDQVAGIYSSLKARYRPTPGPRSLSVKHCRLAQHVGPHVAISIVPPGERAGVGRPPRPGPTGLVQIIAPLPGSSWKSLQHEWNEKYGHWRYESASNFNRDAKNALNRLLWPGWTTRPGNQEP